MHRKLLSAGFILFVLLVSVHADYSRWVTAQVSAGTSAISYGDKGFRDFNKVLLSDDFKRFVFLLDVSGGLRLDEHIRFSFGSILNYDSFTKSSYQALYLDYNFYTGIRIYPELQGLNFGIDYVLGRRSNLFKLPSSYIDSSSSNNNVTSTTTHTPWGNGFRLTAEYDFMYDTTGFAPMIGLSWRCMPRGSVYDNVFSVFMKILFR